MDKRWVNNCSKHYVARLSQSFTIIKWFFFVLHLFIYLFIYLFMDFYLFFCYLFIYLLIYFDMCSSIDLNYLSFIYWSKLFNHFTTDRLIEMLILVKYKYKYMYKYMYKYKYKYIYYYKYKYQIKIIKIIKVKGRIKE